MYQAHARELLNQKDVETDSYMQEDTLERVETTTSAPVSPVNVAAQRLDMAIIRLERNLQHVTVQQERGMQQEQQLMKATRENDTLRSECAGLKQNIAQMEEQYAELQKAASTVYDKLDASIERINQIIES